MKCHNRVKWMMSQSILGHFDHFISLIRNRSKKEQTYPKYNTNPHGIIPWKLINKVVLGRLTLKKTVKPKRVANLSNWTTSLSVKIATINTQSLTRNNHSKLGVSKIAEISIKLSCIDLLYGTLECLGNSDISTGGLKDKDYLEGFVS